ncbi:hypothetical protein BABINDRAFT_159714 [Babjeviella inositovora NRRL Y-12698]|uniref:Uncharacterized protein n=1 Tax=Babjeviella inositovora NRRL Y-12698 TaxID=984486 RepID=A0A1E3QWP2_9ASCO|nr:uncharacterized protein BABINDRAFT_159714 [Babjeviella inositovora NRRL Y-12698]ODQ81417.1 hypothetical protein BABINDRAFT_159714 [Babjeviella inositovora NRRL Y-12698]
MPQFNDLGPADLVHLTKTGNKHRYGTFFNTAGVDTSNSATIASHLMDVVKVFHGKPQTWFGKSKTYSIEKAVFCAFNAFSKVDARVTIHVPGSTEVTLVGANGPVEGSERLWLETYISSIARCLLTSGEDEEELNHVVETRRINPLTSVTGAETFFQAFEAMFWDGPRLGAACDVQVPSLTNNYLVDTFLKAVEVTRKFDTALEVLHRLQERDPRVISIVAQVLLMQDEEVKAIQTIAHGIRANPRNAALLILQAKYLMEKSQYAFALAAATQAVKASPSEFRPWEILTKVYVAMGEYEQALLTINSCPMFANKERYSFKRVTPVNRNNLHLPLPIDATLEAVTGLNAMAIQEEQLNADPSLMNLQATGLKSTFAAAYDLLTDIIHRIGWEKLLKVRTKVFVMEEEYRKGEGNESYLKDSTQKKDNNGTTAGDAGDSGFKTKRLCERWLDHLFMVLYDDLKVYTLWQTELLQFQAQNMEYKKSPLEWELLGLVATRLRHFKEASVAFTNALTGRFSVKSTRRLLKYFQKEKHKLVKLSQSGEETALAPAQIAKSLATLDTKIVEFSVNLTVWDHRWYIEYSPTLILALAGIVSEKGVTKVMNQIVAKYTSEGEGVVELMNDTFLLFEEFGFAGVDAS